MPSHPNQLSTITDDLITVTGGAGTADANQAELRQMAQQYLSLIHI